MTSVATGARQTWTALRALVLFTVAIGIVFPAAIGLVGLAMPSQANGSLVRSDDGRVVGSSLIGQSFTTSRGAALRQWFQSRPSAAGRGYDGSASSGSNLGPNSAELVSVVRARQRAVAALEGVPVSRIPPDAVTASASGLDPDISVAYALLQVPRVARERGLDPGRLHRLVEAHIRGRDLGLLGEPRVNVLELNLTVSRLR